MKPIKISFRGFERLLYRFLNKRILTHPIHIDLVDKQCELDVIINSLIKTYRRHPFKRKSSYKIGNCGEKKKDIKIGYVFENNVLSFKLFVRRGLKYRRLTQLVVIISDPGK